MSILSCECTAVMSDDVADIVKYNNRYYEVLHQEQGALTITIYCSLSGGVFYTEGSAEIVGGCLSLTYGTRANREIEFESVPWGVTFAVTYSGDVSGDIIYFHDNEVAGPKILRLLRSGD